MNEEQNIRQLPKDWKWVKLGEYLNHDSPDLYDCCDANNHINHTHHKNHSADK